MRLAIKTSYHVSDTRKTSYILATCDNGRIISVEYTDNLTNYQNHATACKAMCDDLKWKSPLMLGGSLDGDMYWLPVQEPME